MTSREDGNARLVRRRGCSDEISSALAGLRDDHKGERDKVLNSILDAAEKLADEQFWGRPIRYNWVTLDTKVKR